MPAYKFAQIIFSTTMHFKNANNMWKFLYVNTHNKFHMFFKNKARQTKTNTNKQTKKFLGHFFQGFQYKNAHISTQIQNKHMLWLFIFLVKTHRESFGTNFILIRWNLLVSVSRLWTGLGQLDSTHLFSSAVPLIRFHQKRDIKAVLTFFFRYRQEKFLSMFSVF